MPVYAAGRVEHQKRTQTATTLWPFGFVFGVQLSSLEKKLRREPVRAVMVHIVKNSIVNNISLYSLYFVGVPWP